MQGCKFWGGLVWTGHFGWGPGVQEEEPNVHRKQEFKDGDWRLSGKTGVQDVGDGDSPHVPGGRDLKGEHSPGAHGRREHRGTGMDTRSVSVCG